MGVLHVCTRQSFVHILCFQQLTEVGVPEFAEDLNAAVQSNKSEIANSSLTISAIVNIVNKISVLSKAVNHNVMKVGQFLPCAQNNLYGAPLASCMHVRETCLCLHRM